MKAVIFSCSLKDPKYSTSKGWSDLMADRLEKQGVSAKVVVLKEYDYEASTGKDMLHEQMAHVYDSDLIIFASPTNISHMTFSCKNLIDRFIHANEKAKAQGLDIFSGKFWEYALFFGTSWVDDPVKGRYKEKYHDEEHRFWRSHHGKMIKTFDFIEHLGYKDIAISTWSPDDPTGPRHNDMGDFPEVVAMCDKIVAGFKKKMQQKTPKTPSCSLEKFMDLFSSDNPNAFGRGMTISEENINRDSVIENIALLQKVKNASHRGVAFMSMKERCTKLRLYDLAEMYYVEQFKLAPDPEYRITCSGNYRPNGY